jgi:hypothetical protein
MLGDEYLAQDQRLALGAEKPECLSIVDDPDLGEQHQDKR